MKTCNDCFSFCEKTSPDFYKHYSERTDVYSSCPHFIDKKVVRNIKKEDKVYWRSACEDNKLVPYVVKEIIREKGKITGFDLFRAGVVYYCDVSELGVNLFVRKKKEKK